MKDLEEDIIVERENSCWDGRWYLPFEIISNLLTSEVLDKLDPLKLLIAASPAPLRPVNVDSIKNSVLDNLIQSSMESSLMQKPSTGLYKLEVSLKSNSFTLYYCTIKRV